MGYPPNSERRFVSQPQREQGHARRVQAMQSDEEMHRPPSLDGERLNRAVRLRPFTTTTV